MFAKYDKDNSGTLETGELCAIFKVEFYSLFIFLLVVAIYRFKLVGEAWCIPSAARTHIDLTLSRLDSLSYT